MGLLKQLDAAFDLHVVTLNYDDLVERAFGWGGVEQGLKVIPSQAAAEFIAFDKAPRLMHLHGSVKRFPTRTVRSTNSRIKNTKFQWLTFGRRKTTGYAFTSAG